MTKVNVQQLANIIARLEHWQNKPSVQHGLQVTSGASAGGNSELNAIKHRLITFLNNLEG